MPSPISGSAQTTQTTSAQAAGSAFPATLTLDLDVPGDTFSLERARAMRAVSDLIYQTKPETVVAQLEKWGFDKRDVNIYLNSKGEPFGLLAGKGDSLLIAFRGTAGYADVEADLKALNRQKDTDYERDYGLPGYVHRGFLDALQTSWGERDGATFTRDLGPLMRKFPQAEMFITGHSLGGAQALIAAGRIAQMQPLGESATPERFKSVGARGYAAPFAVYTFGAPPIGNEEYVKAANEKIGSVVFRVENDNDIVVKAPAMVGFKSPGRPVHLGNGEAIVGGTQAGSLEDDRQVRLSAHLLAGYGRNLDIDASKVKDAPSSATGGWQPR